MILSLSLALALLASAPPFPVKFQEMSPAAVALADAIVPPTNPEVLDGIRRQVTPEILGVMLASRGPGCDKQLPACRAGAEAVARENAPEIAAQSRRQRVRVMAFIFDARMSPDAIKQSLTFIKTSAGRSMASALADLSDARRLPADLAGKIFELNSFTTMPDDITVVTLANQFYDRTRNLPRGTPPLMPPPPLAPPPPIAPKQ